MSPRLSHSLPAGAERQACAPRAAGAPPIEAVVLGASAGGVEAIGQVLDGLGAGWHLPLTIVLHLPEHRDSGLAALFAMRLPVPVREAEDKMPLEGGTVYFAPSGYHLSIESDRRFSLSCEPPVLFSRPSIDLLMASAADVYGPALCGVLLTGANEDGAEGMARIREAGGLTVVQDPLEALVPTMPQAAIARCVPDHVMTLSAIRTLLRQLEPRHVP